MYHDVYAADFPRADVPQTAAIYHVPRSAFQEHLSVMRESGIPILTAGEYLDGRAGGRDHIVLTFDDGWAGSLTVAVECLVEAGLRATFFVTRDYVGRRHFATRHDLEGALSAGMEFGTHGCTHRTLVGCTRETVVRELSDSRAFLEDVTAQQILTGSIPEGDWSPLLSEVAETCGYRALATSQPGLNREDTPRYRLRRVAVRAGMGPSTLSRYCQFSLRPELLRHGALEFPKRTLGVERYMRVRKTLLRVASSVPGRTTAL